MLNLMEYSLPAAIRADLEAEIAAWDAARKTARIWSKDASVWTNDDEAKWLGWLDIVGEELADLKTYRSLQSDIRSAGFTDVLLMGMGGSSLCPEVLARTFGKASFHILDSTVPAQVKAIEERLDLTKTLFIVASKSGSTLEPNCFKQYFFHRVSQLVGAESAGRQFIAITDPGSKMEQVARDDGFRHIFFGKPEIGGRFSALSAFGMTAAASMGLDVEGFLRLTEPMVNACRSDDAMANPGALLGLILGVCHRHGRDKLTIITTPEVSDVGAWLEQLIAESTGKNGVAIIPVDGEAKLAAEQYSDDRVFVFLCLSGQGENAGMSSVIAAAGHPVVEIVLEGIASLGQEFFRWEFATAVAGAIMQINPFNQPDVESAKIEAKKITERYERTGSLPPDEPFLASDGFSLFTGEEYAAALTTSSSTIFEVLRAHFDGLEVGDYFAVLAYVEMDPNTRQHLMAIRTHVLERYGNATCLGFGPRFLHSTGQAYKGGANNGVFLQITADDAVDIPVPGQKYTFGVVKAAQARGDFQVLLDRGRRALRVHIAGETVSGLERLCKLL